MRFRARDVRQVVPGAYGDERPVSAGVSRRNEGQTDARARVLAKRAVLPIARLGYAGVVGVAMLVATFRVDANATGAYVYIIGLASVLAMIGGLGLDRLVARRVAAAEIDKVYPVKLLKLRGIEGTAFAALLMLTSVILESSKFSVGAAASCSLFVLSRMLYQDIESFWIAADRSQLLLSIAVTVNGLITAAGVCGGAAVGSPTMMVLGTASGNVIALVFLFPFDSLGRFALEDTFAEARGTAASLFVAAAYSRVDLLILGIAGIPLEDVAIYGLVLRVFDALLIVRSALSQQEARDVAWLSLPTRRRTVTRYGVGVCLGVSAISVALVLLLYVVWRLFPDLESLNWALFSSAVLAVPLFFAHQTTSVMILADRRNDLLFWGSVLACILCIGVKLLLIKTHGVAGAILAIGVVEWISCFVFSFIYFGRNFRLIAVATSVPILGVVTVYVAYISAGALLN